MHTHNNPSPLPLLSKERVVRLGEKVINMKQGKDNYQSTAIILSLVLVASVVGMVWMQSEKYNPILVGEKAVDFSLPDLDGREVRLSDLRGKVVLLNFWATWCKPCKEEMPSMEELYQILKEKDFAMLAVSIDKKSSDIKPFKEELKLTLPILHDRWGSVDRRYKLTGVPETYIIDQNGILAEKIIGPRDWTKTENVKVILDLLQNGPRASSKTS